MRWFLILLLSVMGLSAQTYTEFYCQTTADNLNAGSTKENSANTSYAGGTFVRATGVFTVASGNPTSDTGVTNGAWASIYTTSGATIATCVGRITNTTANTLTIDIGTVSGATANVSETAAAATAKVGGAWKGPNAAVALPFGFIATNSINTAGTFPRVNFLSGVNYAITAAMTHNLAGPVRFEGYTSSPGDGGKATIDGGATGTSYVLLTCSGTDNMYVGLIFSNNGNSGSALALVSSSANRNMFTRCVFHDAYRGCFSSSAPTVLNECEGYNANKSNNTGQQGVFVNGSSALYSRCIAHDSTGTLSDGFVNNGTICVYRGCVSDSNARNGFIDITGIAFYQNCDSYNNGSNGLDVTTTVANQFLIENCNFVKNGGWGIGSTPSPARGGAIVNCGFGSGTSANTLGDISSTNLVSVEIISKISYAANAIPWVDAPNGDFTINLTASKAAGRGAFTETAASYSGTVSFPDVGAAQTASTNAAAAGGSWTFSQ